MHVAARNSKKRNLLSRLFGDLFPPQLSLLAVDRAVTKLSMTKDVPSGLRCIGWTSDGGACDGMHWKVYQDKQDQVWVHAWGGIANIDVWYGPGESVIVDEILNNRT